MGEHLLISTNPKDLVRISDLHQLYLNWCVKNEVDVPVVKEILGKVVKKLFGNLKTKAVMKQGESAYYYQNLLFVDDDFRENTMQKRVKIPPHMSIEVEHEMIQLNIPTTLVVNTQIQEFKVYLSLETEQYHITFRGDELKLWALGIGEYSPFDQMFVNSMSRICEALVLCLGKPIDLPLGNKPSTNLLQTFIGRLSPNNTTEQVTTTYYSTHCLRVLPLNGELNNRTCSQCVHDINQRIRQLKNSGCISESVANGLLKRVKSDVWKSSGSDTTDKDSSLDKSNDEPPRKKQKTTKAVLKLKAPEPEVITDGDDEDEHPDSGIDDANESDQDEELVLSGGGKQKGGSVRYQSVSLLIYILQTI